MRKYLLVLIIALIFLCPSLSEAKKSIETVNLSIEGEMTLGMDFMSYQEHIPDYNNKGTIGNLESNANPAFGGLLSRAEIIFDKNCLGIRAMIPVYKGVVKETWKLNGADFQTNDLSYTLTYIDAYGGYKVNALFFPIAGLRGLKGEQVRENFYNNGIKANTGQAIETINSLNAFIEARGKTTRQPIRFDYNIGFLYPFNVSTTNSLIPGFDLSSGGYTLYGGINAGWSVGKNYYAKAGLSYQMIHYSGTDWQSQGGQTVKWPANDTKDLAIKLSVLADF